jgi:uncharacterized protein YjbI with pentapeptide repeats/serine/threonine protein kinase
MTEKKKPGTLVSSRYRIEKTLGEGAMGVVYRALDIRLDRPIALKLIELGKPGKERDEMEKRVLREAQTPAKMNHPGIVIIYDYGVEEDYAFIAMEFVEGRTIESILAEYGRFALLKTVEITERIAEALNSAHALNFIHRDIKPANVMLMRDGSVKVMDFGLAKGTAPTDVSVTRAGMLIGTPKYMSPEQIRGRALDPRTDIYSLGVVVYEMLTGKSPYSAKDIYGLLNSVLHEEAPPASTKHPKVPRLIDNILAKAMAKRPELRYQRASEFAVALRQAINTLKAQKSLSDSQNEGLNGESTGSTSRRRKAPVPTSEDLGLPDLEGSAARSEPGQQGPVRGQVTREGAAQTVVSTQAVEGRWLEKVRAEEEYQRENLCLYKYQSLDAIQGYCPEPRWPQSKHGFCVAHDPDLDKSKLNVRKNLEDRARQKANLEGAQLCGVQLMEAQLSGIRLAFADLTGANLQGANLWEAEFVNAVLKGACLDRTNCLAAHFEQANLTRATFKSAKLKSAYLQRATLNGANFSGADFQEANLEHAVVLSGDLSKCDCRKAIFDNANLTGSDLRHTNFAESSLKNVDFSQCKLKGAIFLRARIVHSTFSLADIEKADLSGSKLRENNLSGLKAAFVNLEKADLWGADLSNADLRGANLQGAELGRANLEGANLEGANLKGAHLRKAILRRANLTRARLTEADLIEADIRGALLTEIEIQGADLSGILLDINGFPVGSIPTWNKAIWDVKTKRQLEVKSWGFE